MAFEAWGLLSHGHLLLSKVVFSKNAISDPSLAEFLVSYMHACCALLDDSLFRRPQARLLRTNVFLLTHRVFMDVVDIPPSLLDISFLESLCIVYSHNSKLPELLTRGWGLEGLEDVSPSVIKKKLSLIQALDTSEKNSLSESDDLRKRTVAVLRVSYHYGQFLMVGSDFLDALASASLHTVPSIQKEIVTMTYWCLVSLLHPEHPRLATLIDHLYSLESNPAGSSTLRALCLTTPFLQKFRRSLSGREAARGQLLLERLSSFEAGVSQKPKRIIRRQKIRNGDTSNDSRIERIALLTQVQDVFPDLDSDVVAKLLDENGGDAETVIAHLLDNPQLSHMQDSLLVNKTPKSQASIEPSKGRRSVFDDDAFSRLAISPSQVHRGRRFGDSKDADTLLSAPTSTSHKEAILSALAAFDADDDERDDTYDVEDVGGTVDSALPGTSDDIMDADGLKQNVHEETLWQAWKVSPELFGRDLATKRSQARAALRKDTGMTDEAIEGWAIMLQRDPKKIKRVEAMFSLAGGGKQRPLGRSAWRGSPAGSGTEAGEDGDTDGDRGPIPRGAREGTRIRGRGRGGGGRGGNVAGPANDQGTQAARQRKDANKGSRANHNRRDQRARKMARGGFAG